MSSQPSTLTIIAVLIFSNLKLSGTIFPQDYAYGFQNSAQFESKQIHDNMLPDIIKQLYKKKPKLRGLWLGKNYLTSIPEGLFDKFLDLEFLDLSGNPLTTLPATMLTKLINLKKLNLGQTKIKQLPANFFIGPDQLEMIDLCCQGLQNFPKSLLGLKRLTMLAVYEKLQPEESNYEEKSFFIPLSFQRALVGQKTISEFLRNNIHIEVTINNEDIIPQINSSKKTRCCNIL